MSCCLASSREKTTTRCGVPSSPLKSRRTIAFPSEPVPPVTRTRFPSSIGAHNLGTMRDCGVRCSIGAELLDHPLPLGLHKAGSGPEAIGVKTAVRLDIQIPIDRGLSSERAIDQ